MKNLKAKLIKFLFPDKCPYCNKAIENYETACKKCIDEMPQLGISHGVFGGYRCTSPLHYHGKYRTALLRFKFKNKTHYAKNFSYLMQKQVNKSYEDMIFDYITYVPMYSADEHKRGYNQSELLAKELSQHLKIPLIDTLVKTKHTKPQHTLKTAERLKNLKGVFKVTDKNLVKGKAILLVDDVVTTGTTLSECSKTLNKAKPSMICCVTLLSTGNLYLP